MGVDPRLAGEAGDAVVMAHIGATVFAVAGPVGASAVEGIGEGVAVWLGAGENVMLVTPVAEFHGPDFTRDHLAGFRHGGADVDEVAFARQQQGVAEQLAEVGGDAHTVGVVPGALADAVPCVDGGGVSGGLCREKSAPSAVARVHSFGQFLAMGVRPGQTAEVGTVTDTDAGDEEGHRPCRRPRRDLRHHGCVLGEGGCSSGEDERCEGEEGGGFHGAVP